MPRNTTISLVRNEWTELTAANVTHITFQNLTDTEILVKGTADATEPADTDGALEYEEGQGELNTALADLWPGITAVRVWALSPHAARMMVSHT